MAPEPDKPSDLPAVCPANHTYSASAICVSVQMVLEGAIGLRASNAVLDLLQPFLAQFLGVPAASTIQSWLLRLGLHELRRPKEKADDWILFLDHTIQLGRYKCLLIVGIRQSTWERLPAPITHHDLTFLALEPVAESDGEKVRKQVEAVTEIVGIPLATLSDEGSDLTNGIGKFSQNHPQTLVRNDIAHKSAIFLKRELAADARWELFVKNCGNTQPKVKQTELGHLAPPTLKVKARYMNLGPLIAWGTRMLRLIDTAPNERPAELNGSRLDEKFGWIANFREALPDWQNLQATIDCALTYARVEGYHATAGVELREELRSVVVTEAGQRMAESLVQFVEDQSREIPPGTSLPASSEVLESLIGKGKRLQGQHSRGGFTKMILGMAASVVHITNEVICEALGNIRNIDLLDWSKQKLGISLTAQRRHALPLITGTEPD